MVGHLRWGEASARPPFLKSEFWGEKNVIESAGSLLETPIDSVV